MKFYITTPIYYVNDLPHIGHAYTTIAADALARYKRQRGYDVLFITGTDEHGQKIEQSAKERGISVSSLVEETSENFKRLWKELNISYNDFIRTTSERHKRTARYIFELIYKKGDIYYGAYEGNYCVACESYIKEKSCPSCGREGIFLSQPTYYFRLSRYKNSLLSYFKENPNFIMPPARQAEMENIVNEKLSDLSITRKNLKWGIPIPIPGDDVMYVWFEALTNYLTGASFLDDKERFERYWPPDIHLVGKDILRFHVIIWPAMLISCELPLPKMVFGHGWWKVKEEKISKSLGNIISAFELLEDVGADCLRYFLLRDLPFGLDGEFSYQSLIARLNTDLANDLGNLITRTITMAHKYLSSIVPKRVDNLELREHLEDILKHMDSDFDNLRFHLYLDRVWAFINLCNKYIDREKPWAISNRERLSSILYSLLESLRLIASFIAPIMPGASEKILKSLGSSSLGFQWGLLREGTNILQPFYLFKRR